MSKKIILTGGGTAGHVMPNLALVPALREKGFDIVYICAKDGMEKDIVEKSGLKNYAISSGKLRRYFSFKNFTDPFRILAGYSQSKNILKNERPNVVFSKGGFVTVPVVFAAKSLHIPVVLHESDYTPGLANKLCIPRAQRVCISFEAAAKHIPQEKCVMTGSPVRPELFEGNRQNGLSFLGFDGSKPLLLIMGGSQGAQAVNEAFDAVADRLLETFDVVHLRGAGKLNDKLNGKKGYAQYEFVSAELSDVFAATDIVLSRSGANAIFEFLALGIPSLLVPLPLEASRGDQILNAEWFRDKGFSMVLPQGDITPERLYSDICTLYEKSDEMKDNMKNSGFSDGTGRVVEVICKALGGNN